MKRHGPVKGDLKAGNWHDPPQDAREGRCLLDRPKPDFWEGKRDRHRFVVITPQVVNALGVVMTVPVTGGGKFSRETGMTVPILGHNTQCVAVCNQVRSFDIEERVKAGTARFVEKLDTDTAEEIVSRVLSIIDPEENTHSEIP